MLTLDQKPDGWRVRLSHQAGENRVIREGQGQLTQEAFNEVVATMIGALRGCGVVE
jgi:hypothetical protein